MAAPPQRPGTDVTFGALRSVDDVTPALLTDLFRSAGHAAVVEAVEVRRADKGATDHLWLTLRYRENDAGMPAEVFVKTQLDTRVDLGSSFAESFADPAMTQWMRAESRFYTDLAPGLGLELPAVFVAGRAAPPTHFILVEEDVLGRGAWFPDPATALAVDDVHALVDVLASLHAAFWDAPELAAGGALEWVETPTHGVFASFVRSDPFVHGVADQQFALPRKAELLSSAGFDVDTFWTAVWQLQRMMTAGPMTLVHGDAHIGNTYRLPDGSWGLVDWQLLRRACWVHDLSYTVVSSLGIDDRRAHERDIIGRYLSRLRQLGVSAPDEEIAWTLWRAAPVWGLLMWVATPYAMYTQEKVDRTLARFATACADLGTAALLRDRRAGGST